MHTTNKLRSLSQFIEIKRSELFNIAQTHSLNSNEVIKASTELDILLNIYQSRSNPYKTKKLEYYEIKFLKKCAGNFK